MATTQERVQALAQTISRLADQQGATYEETLADLEKEVLIQRFRKVQSQNRAEAEARGDNPSDIAEWIEEDRKINRGR